VLNSDLSYEFLNPSSEYCVLCRSGTFHLMLCKFINEDVKTLRLSVVCMSGSNVLYTFLLLKINKYYVKVRRTLTDMSLMNRMIN